MRPEEYVLDSLSRIGKKVATELSEESPYSLLLDT